MINFFSLNDQLTFADLPGYGFNKAPKHESVSWQALMDGYFANRALKRVLFLLDARRTPNEEDLRFYHWLSAKYETDVVLTKTDKLKRSELKVTRARIEDLLGAKVRVRAVSSLKRQGISELRDDLTAASLA